MAQRSVIRELEHRAKRVAKGMEVCSSAGLIYECDTRAGEIGAKGVQD
jgi:hypothetical protein